LRLICLRPDACERALASEAPAAVYWYHTPAGRTIHWQCQYSYSEQKFKSAALIEIQEGVCSKSARTGPNNA